MVEACDQEVGGAARGSQTPCGSLGRRRSSRWPRRLRLRSILRRCQTHQPQQVVRRPRDQHLQSDFPFFHRPTNRVRARATQSAEMGITYETIKEYRKAP